MGPEIIALVLAAGIIGAAIGTFTGIVPGIHVNTATTVLLGSYPLMEEVVSGFCDPSFTPVLISCCIMSAATVHSFVDFVPSVFIGAPDPDDSLTVLPGHRLLSEGRGMVAVRAAAIGSAVGSVAALALSIPLQWLMLRGGSEIIDCFTFGVVTVTILVIILVSSDRLITAAMLLLTGFMGLAINSEIIPVIGIIEGGTLLFPLLTGLFGLPPLLDNAAGGRIPDQYDDGNDPVGPMPGIKGVATGILAGWFPGITATAGATLASAVTRENDPARFISMTASIGTVTSVFSLVTLSVSGSGRSGPSMAVKQVIGDSLGGFCSEAFVLILLSMALATLLGYVSTIGAGKLMVRISDRISPVAMGDAVLGLIVILVLLFTGPFGLAVLVVSAAVGRIPPALGVSRVCLTGCLMLPVVLNVLL